MFNIYYWMINCLYELYKNMNRYKNFVRNYITIREQITVQYSKAQSRKTRTKEMVTMTFHTYGVFRDLLQYTHTAK